MRSKRREKIPLGLDYFDASINRVAAWVIGARNLLKALLIAFLEPVEILCAAENGMDFTRRLAVFEEIKGLPWASVWDNYCLTRDVPVGTAWLDAIAKYENDVLGDRDARQRLATSVAPLS